MLQNLLKRIQFSLEMSVLFVGDDLRKNFKRHIAEQYKSLISTGNQTGFKHRRSSELLTYKNDRRVKIYIVFDSRKVLVYPHNVADEVL